jgi:hypothetical protein
MTKLTQSDFLKVLTCLREIHSLADLPNFATKLLEAVSKKYSGSSGDSLCRANARWIGKGVRPEDRAAIIFVRPGL